MGGKDGVDNGVNAATDSVMRERLLLVTAFSSTSWGVVLETIP